MNVGLFSPLADELTHLPGFDGNLEQVYSSINSPMCTHQCQPDSHSFGLGPDLPASTALGSISTVVQ